MKQVVLDGKSFKKVDDFHEIFKAEIELPDYYGSNLDALWDVLTGFVETPISIKWIAFDESLKNLGEDAQKIKNLFEEAAQEVDGLKFEITSDV